ncbi:MAG: hypothetical protein LBT46_11575 [Planctomycetaceae bacterium]|nr:hypothetical protein [Planctomycetaceae bacterium]
MLRRTSGSFEQRYKKNYMETFTMFAAISEGLSLFAAVFVFVYALLNSIRTYNGFKNQQRQIDELKQELEQIKNNRTKGGGGQ